MVKTTGASLQNRSEKAVSNHTTIPWHMIGSASWSGTGSAGRWVRPVAPRPPPALTLSSFSSPLTPSVLAVIRTSSLLNSVSNTVMVARSSDLTTPSVVHTCAPLTP